VLEQFPLQIFQLQNLDGTYQQVIAIARDLSVDQLDQHTSQSRQVQSFVVRLVSKQGEVHLDLQEETMHLRNSVQLWQPNSFGFQQLLAVKTLALFR
jgi:hypothetical protein